MVARVLEQVAAQLLRERGLVVLEALVVVRAEPDRVLVGHVDALDRGGLVGVHLLGELAGDLDRLHAGAEGAAEHALDEALDAGFKVAQNADGWLLDRWVGRPGDAGRGEMLVRRRLRGAHRRGPRPRRRSPVRRRRGPILRARARRRSRPQGGPRRAARAGWSRRRRASESVIRPAAQIRAPTASSSGRAAADQHGKRERSQRRRSRPLRPDRAVDQRHHHVAEAPCPRIPSSAPAGRPPARAAASGARAPPRRRSRGSRCRREARGRRRRGSGPRAPDRRVPSPSRPRIGAAPGSGIASGSIAGTSSGAPRTATSTAAPGSPAPTTSQRRTRASCRA